MWKSKKKLVGVFKISHTSASSRIWYLLIYSISRKIFWLVSTLFGLKTTDNLFEFKYLYLNQTFSKSHNKIVFMSCFFVLFYMGENEIFCAHESYRIIVSLL